MMKNCLKIQLAVIVIIRSLDVVLNITEIKSVCRTIHNEPGVCKPILTCAAKDELLSPQPQSVIMTARRSHCPTINGVVHVCCRRNRVTNETELAQTINTTIPISTVIEYVAESKGSCLTQSNETGVCIPILRCETITKLVQTSSSTGGPLPDSVILTVKQSHCGTFSGIVHSCCKPSSEQNDVALNSRSVSCRTLLNQTGICVPILTCGSITELLQKSSRPLPSSVVQSVRQSHCGTFNDVHHVCCLADFVSEIVEPPLINKRMSSDEHLGGGHGPCKTLRNETGVCVPILTCATILHLLQISSRPLPDFVKEIVKQSHCGTIGNIPNVCCKSNRISNN